MKRLFGAFDHVRECPLCMIGAALCGLVVVLLVALISIVIAVWIAGGAA
jgi:hypothetical protein